MVKRTRWGWGNSPPPPPPPPSHQATNYAAAVAPPFGPHNTIPPPPPKKQRWGRMSNEGNGSNASVPRPQLPNQDSAPSNAPDSLRNMQHEHQGAPQSQMVCQPTNSITSPNNNTNNNTHPQPNRAEAQKRASFGSADEALKALHRRKRLEAWKLKMKQQGTERLPEGGSLSDGEVEEAQKQYEQVALLDTTTEKYNNTITANGKSDQEEDGEKTGEGNSFAMMCQVITEVPNDKSPIIGISPSKPTGNDPVKNVEDNDRGRSHKTQEEPTLEIRPFRDESENTARAHRLNILRHSSDCKASAGQCTVFSECAQTKILWRHLINCKQVDCPVKHCSLSREVLRDYAIQKKSAEGKASPIKWQPHIKQSTVQPTRVEPKQTKDHTNTLKMHRINLLKHSSECKAEPGKCPLFTECAKARTLWRHMAGCREISCPVKDCSISREILREYFNSMKEDAKVTTKTTPPSSVGQGASPKKRLPANSPVQVTAKTMSPSSVGQGRSPKKPLPASSPPGGSNKLNGNLFDGVRLASDQLNAMASQDRSKKVSDITAKNQHANEVKDTKRSVVKDASNLIGQFEEKQQASPVADLTGKTTTETTILDTIAVKPYPVEERTMEKKNLLPEKRARAKKHRLFKNRMKIATQPVERQSSAKISNTSGGNDIFIQATAVSNETKRQRQGAKSRSKKKTAASLNSLWDYDFNPSSSSDSEQDYDDVLQADVDIVGDDEKTIYSKVIPHKSRSDEMSQKNTAIFQSKIRSLNDQIRKADSVIQLTAPSYMAHLSKGWKEVASARNSTFKDRRQMIEIPPSEKFHAAPNTARDFLSLLKSTALKASNNSNQIANAHVMGFLAIIKDVRNNNTLSSNPYQLIRRVDKLISSVTTSTSSLNENEGELARTKLRRKFDSFLPQGYTMLSENYLWGEKSNHKEEKEDNFVESCARTYLAFNYDEAKK